MDLIDWTCDTCHEKANGSGAIHIAYADIRRAETDRKSWDDRSQAGDFMQWDVTDVLAQPLLALWKVGCNTCAGACEDSYWIDLQTARTPADLLRWTAHLEVKGWFTASNWSALIASVGQTQPIRSAV